MHLCNIELIDASIFHAEKGDILDLRESKIGHLVKQRPYQITLQTLTDDVNKTYSRFVGPVSMREVSDLDSLVKELDEESRKTVGEDPIKYSQLLFMKHTLNCYGYDENDLLATQAKKDGVSLVVPASMSYQDVNELTDPKNRLDKQLLTSLKVVSYGKLALYAAGVGALTYLLIH